MRKRLYAVGIVMILTMICIVACSNNNKSLSSESTSSLGAKTETASTGEEKHLAPGELDRILEAQITQEDRDAVIKMEHRVRLKGTEEWAKSVDASVGDTLEFSIYYTNVSGVNVENVMLKVTLPTVENFYEDLTKHPRVVRVVALSGGYPREKANEILSKNKGIIASFSRALTEGLSAQQSDEEFNKALEATIEEIYEASVK